MIKIGVMGAVGSFSEQAGEHYRTSEGLFESVIVPLVTAEAVLAALAEKAIDKAVFPVMNNNGGLVIEAIMRSQSTNVALKLFLRLIFTICSWWQTVWPKT